MDNFFHPFSAFLGPTKHIPPHNLLIAGYGPFYVRVGILKQPLLNTMVPTCNNAFQRNRYSI